MEKQHLAITKNIQIAGVIKIQKKAKIDIGGTDKYESLCRKCFLDYTN